MLSTPWSPSTRYVRSIPGLQYSLLIWAMNWSRCTVILEALLLKFHFLLQRTIWLLYLRRIDRVTLSCLQRLKRLRQRSRISRRLPREVGTKELNRAAYTSFG